MNNNNSIKKEKQSGRFMHLVGSVVELEDGTLRAMAYMDFNSEELEKAEIMSNVMVELVKKDIINKTGLDVHEIEDGSEFLG